MRKRIPRILLAGTLLLAATPQTATASTLTLADLQGGASFSSLNGFLEFSDFSVVASGSILSPLDTFEVIPLDQGFRLAGPFTAFDDTAGSLSLDYTVTGIGAFLAASLFFDGAAFGDGAEAAILETYGSFGSAGVQSTEGEPILEDQFIFPNGAPSVIDVSKLLTVQSVSGGSAVIGVADQGFTVVPEPSTALLLLLGAGGALLLRRRSPR